VVTLRTLKQLIDNYELEPGESANFFASQLAKLGARVRVIGRVGQDAQGDFILQKLQAIGVETSRVSRHPLLKTGLGAALADPQGRAFLTFLGTIDTVQPQDFPEEVSTVARHWHIASYFLPRVPRGHWMDWVCRYKGPGMAISVDANWHREKIWEAVAGLLPFVDALFPNGNEAKTISQGPEVVRATELLAYGPLVATKCGRDGPMSLKGDKKWEVHPLVGFGTCLLEARTVVSYVLLTGVVYPMTGVMSELPAQRVQLLRTTLATMPIFPIDLLSRETDAKWDTFKQANPDD
jgi:sugar/nucleoside kinase (ribokinase family)